jgi:hypothetical protein
MDEIRAVIQSAFAGVHLDGGISLRQADAVDIRGQGITDEEFRALPLLEITDDWTALTLETLDRYTDISFFDAKAFRYYIPAFMIAMLDCYKPDYMRVISTLSSLHPKKGGQWEHSMMQYSLLNPQQRAAMIYFLEHLPEDVELDTEDQKIVERALWNYWRKEI